MEFIEQMQKRYSTKLYDSSKTIDAETIEKLREIVTLSPSSINSQPWKISFIVNPVKKQELATASYFNEEKINQAPLLIVFSGSSDIDAFEQWAMDALPDAAMNYYNAYVKQLSPDMIIEWFNKQVYLCVGVLLSACATMGLDSTPMEGIEACKYDKILNHQKHHAQVAVAVGYRNMDDYNQPSITKKDRRSVDDVAKIW